MINYRWTRSLQVHSQGSVRLRSFLPKPKQLCERHTESVSNSAEILEGRIALPAFNGRKIGRMHACSMGEFFLGKP